MNLKTKTAIAISGIIVAFYLINLSIEIYLIHKSNQDYMRTLLDERERAFQEMVSDEFSELRTYLQLFKNQHSYMNLTENLSALMKENYHLDAFLVLSDNGTLIFSGNDIDRDEILRISEVSFTTEPECGFDKQRSLYMVCGQKERELTYILVDRVDDEFFRETKPLLGVDVFYFSNNTTVIETPLMRAVPAPKPGDGIVGYFLFGYSTTLNPAVTRNIMTGILVFTVSAIFLSAAGYILFEKEVVNRIHTVRNYMLRVKRDKFNIQESLRIEGDDEISELADSVNSALFELKKSRNELEKALENLKVINRVLRHDLLNDLTAIKGYSEIGVEVCEYCRKIEERADKAVRTIKLLRDVEETIKEVDLQVFRLSEVIGDVMGNYEIEFEITGDADVLADNGIYSVFENLVNNSIKHGKSNRIVFEIIDEGEFVHVIMKDFGAGIPEESLDSIFDEGYSLSGSTGIGLYIVKKFIEKYGGKIEAETSEREGAVFHLYFKKFRGDSQAQETAS